MNSAPSARHRSFSPSVEARPAVGGGQRRNDAHVAGGGLGDHTGDLAGVRGERLADRVQIVIRQHDGVARLCAGDARGVRQTEGGDAGAGRGEQRVDVPVVAPGELHHLGTAGETARQPDRRHGRLGAGGDESYLLNGVDTVHDLLGERHLVLHGRTEGGAALDGPAHGVRHLGVCVAEDHRPPGADQVDVLPAVRVREVGTGTGHHEPGRTAHSAEGADRGVHASWRHGGGAVEERLRYWGAVRVSHESHGVRARCAGAWGRFTLRGAGRSLTR